MNMRKTINTVLFAAMTACANPVARDVSLPSDGTEVVNIREGTSADIAAAVISKSPEEIALEELQQTSYAYLADKYAIIYGTRLYTNAELLDPNFQPGEPEYFKMTPELRFMQYFLRNGREAALSNASNLGCKHHQTVLGKDHVLTKLFADAGINIEGEQIDWVEIPEGRSGGMLREGKKYGGKNENIMIVEAYSTDMNSWEQKPAQKAGYEVDTRKEWEGPIVNEMSHEIQFKYFSNLFYLDDQPYLSEPFESFQSEIPGLRFKSNDQAAEFLSDVASWSAGSMYFRFFNPLYYMHEKAEFSRGEADRYWYSYQVQKYAMETVLRNKGVSNPEVVVRALIEEANASNSQNHDDLFVSARQHFQEEDFIKIAEIYRRIGVDLLKQMAPYYIEGEER